MSHQTLITKLFIPPVRREQVPRQRLINRLAQGVDGKLTLVSGPAGFGKTTLLSAWIAQTKRPVGWISLDEGDNELNRFTLYLIKAFQEISAGFANEVVEMLFSASPQKNEDFLPYFIHQITEIQEPFLIVLDDYHVITETKIHDLLLAILEYQPPQMHLVILTRSDPPWPLARWRVRGELSEIRMDDLRFTLEEAFTFLNETTRLGLSEHEIKQLDAKTEGWAAGLQMAALSMQKRDDNSSFIQKFAGSHHFVFDYLLDEVFRGLPKETQDFLLDTAILDRLTAPLCDDLRDANDSQQLLERLDQMNLFLIPLDEHRTWYRYHHLFGELLQHLLRQSNPEKISQLHHKASLWYEDHHFIADAITHAFAIDDVERVGRLANAEMLEMLDRGELGLLLQWIDGLPEEIMQKYPWLRVAQAWELTQTGSFEAAIPCLAAVEILLQENTGISKRQQRHITGHIATLRCYIAMLAAGDERLAIQLARQALEQLPQTDMRTRGIVTVYLGTLQRIQQDFSAALETLNSAQAIYRTTNQTAVVVDILSQIARIRREQGLLHETAQICQEALEIADQSMAGGRHRLPVAAYVMGILGRVYYEWNQLDKALDIGLQALELSEKWGQANTLLGNHLFMARIYRAQGNFDKALRSIRAAQKIGSHISETHAFVIHTQEMIIRLAMGEVNAVEQWAALEVKPLETAQDELWWELPPLILALHRAGRTVLPLDALLAALDRFLVISEERGSHRRWVTANIHKAMALQALKEDDQALIFLANALSRAEPEGYIRSFIDQGAGMGDLLKMAASIGIQTNYANQLLSNFQSGQQIAEPLTNREIEVLRLLSADLTVPKIAAELVISVETVRTHVKRIYRKLNVHSRFEAITKARKLHFL